MLIGSVLQIYPFDFKPSAPPVGSFLFYMKTDNTLYVQDSAGNEYAFGSTGFISQLTGDVSAVGPGSAVATVNSVGGVSAVNVASGATLANASTASNIINAIIRRDGSGNFAANVATLNALQLKGSTSGTMTIGAPSTFTDFTLILPNTFGTIGQALITDGAGNLSWASILTTTLADGKILIGNSSNIATPRTPGGDVSMTNVGNFTVNSVGTSSAANIHSAELLANAATAVNTASAIVRRDINGDIAIGALSAISGSFIGANDIVQLLAKGFAGQGSDIFQVQKSDGTVFFKVDSSGNGVLLGTFAASNFSGASSGTNTGDVSLAAVGSTPSANGASLAGQVLTLQPASATLPGVLTAIAQTIGGVKTFLGRIISSDTTQSTDKDTGSIVTEGGIGVEKNINAGGNIAAVGTVTGSNLSGSSSGTNTGDVTAAPIGSTPNANGFTLVGQVLNLEAASGLFGGVVTTLAQTFAGIKTFLAQVVVSDTTQSTNKDTGSIVTEGGLGVEKNINAGGNIAAVGTVTGSNVSGSTSGTNTGDATITDTNSIDLSLAGQNISADLKISTDAADANNIKMTTTVHGGAGAAQGLHVEVPFGNAANIGTANNPGSAASVSLSDHVHAITIAIIGNLVLTGYTIGANAAIAATDTIFQAFGKLQGQISAISGAAITALTGDVTATGPGSVAATIAVGAVTDTKGSLSNKPAVTVVATTNQALTGAPTIDGQATTAGTSIALLTAQTTASENGPWVVQTGAWTRPTWFPTGGTTQAFQFITMLVRLGTTYQGSVWRMTTAGAVTIGTTNTAWAVTPHAGNFRSDYTIGLQTGAAAVTLAFANAFKAIISWNPTANFTLTMPPTLPTTGQFLSASNNTGTLAWTNPNVNIDGGRPDSVYTPAQFITGGTP